MPTFNVYPPNLVPTSGDLTILPRFPTTEEVVLKTDQRVLGVFYNDVSIGADIGTGGGVVVAGITIPAQEVDCLVTLQAVAELIPNLAGTASVITKQFTVNTVGTGLVTGDYCFDYVTLGSGGRMSIAHQARSDIIPANTEITVTMTLEGDAGCAIASGFTTLVASVIPAPVIVP